METFGYLWGPMGTYAVLWGPMGIYGDPWGPLGPYGDLWETMGTYWDLWGVLGTFGDLQGPIGTYGDLWGLFPDCGFFQLFHVGLIFSQPLYFFIFFLGGFLHTHFDTSPPFLQASKLHQTYLLVYTANTTCHIRHQTSDFLHNPVMWTPLCKFGLR